MMEYVTTLRRTEEFDSDRCWFSRRVVRSDYRGLHVMEESGYEMYPNKGGDVVVDKSEIVATIPWSVVVDKLELK